MREMLTGILVVRITVTCFLLIVGAHAYAGAPEGYPFHSFDQAMEKAEIEGKPIFVYFGRYGCGFCEKTNKEGFSDYGVRDAYIGHYVLAYVDSESGRRINMPGGERITERELGARYKALITPVFSFITKDGEVILRLVGAQSRLDLIKADQDVQAILRSRVRP